jgi:NAD(P)-dependent dehydrogenase (short-subunit alcohol dehydrogenase family)
MEAMGRQAMVLTLDLTASIAVRQAVKTALDKFGKIDILVNNAASPHHPNRSRTRPRRNGTDIDINLRSVLIVTRPCCPG